MVGEESCALLLVSKWNTHPALSWGHFSRGHSEQPNAWSLSYHSSYLILLAGSICCQPGCCMGRDKNAQTSVGQDRLPGFWMWWSMSYYRNLQWSDWTAWAFPPFPVLAQVFSMCFNAFQTYVRWLLLHSALRHGEWPAWPTATHCSDSGDRPHLHVPTWCSSSQSSGAGCLTASHILAPQLAPCCPPSCWGTDRLYP